MTRTSPFLTAYATYRELTARSLPDAGMGARDGDFADEESLSSMPYPSLGAEAKCAMGDTRRDASGWEGGGE
jgi:hypothetical protein